MLFLDHYRIGSLDFDFHIIINKWFWVFLILFRIIFLLHNIDLILIFALKDLFILVLLFLVFEVVKSRYHLFLIFHMALHKFSLFVAKHRLLLRYFFVLLHYVFVCFLSLIFLLYVLLTVVDFTLHIILLGNKIGLKHGGFLLLYNFLFFKLVLIPLF